MVDYFGTRNQFYGGQIGARFEGHYGLWVLSTAGKLAKGPFAIRTLRHSHMHFVTAKRHAIGRRAAHHKMVGLSPALPGGAGRIRGSHG